MKIMDIIFFTNNIVESANSRLYINTIIKNKKNTVNIFSKEISKFIYLYYTCSKYNPPIFSKSKAFVNFIITQNFNDNIKLITNEDLINIYINYKNNIYKSNIVRRYY